MALNTWKMPGKRLVRPIPYEIGNYHFLKIVISDNFNFDLEPRMPFPKELLQNI